VEPRIQYAKTTDGVSIAYCVAGSGIPFLHMGWPLSHTQLLWKNPVTRPWLEALAQRYQLVFYDGRGNGLSQRGLTSLTLDMLVLDMEAVIDRLSLDRFVLFAPFYQGQAAVQYCAENQGRASGLILWASYVSGEALDRTRVLTIAEEDWDFFLQLLAQMAIWLEPQQVRAYVDMLRQTVTQEDYVMATREILTFNIEPMLPQVRTPTLVMHPKDLATVKAEQSMRLASLIPGARLILLEGASGTVAGDIIEPTIQAIDEFVKEVVVGEASQEQSTVSGTFRTILFTDVEGSTALTQRLGDAKARDLLREHERIVREALRAHGGSELKTTGDGFMASFSSATKALECSIAMQRAFAAWNEAQAARPSTAPARGGQAGRAEEILVRVGLNAGEPIAEDDPDGRSDLFGTAVIEAARIAAAAKGGEILVSDVVRQLAKGKEFSFVDRGELDLKGFDEPVRLYEVRWREEM